MRPAPEHSPVNGNAIEAAAESAASRFKHLLFYGRPFADSVIARAAGAYIYDEAGRAILDFSSGQMCATVGHSHPAVVAAIEKACREAIHLDSTKISPAVIDLAEELCALLPRSSSRRCSCRPAARPTRRRSGWRSCIPAGSRSSD